jgi:APA family basic amino acid/polyamine antiporter
MARDGLFFAGIAAVHPRRGTPTRAIAIQAFLAAALAMSGSFEEILSYFMAPTLVFLALTLTAVFALRRRPRPSDEPPWEIPGYPVSPWLFLLPVLAVIALQILRNPVRGSIGLSVVALGVPVSAWVLAHRRPAGAVEAPLPPALTDRESVPTIGTNP